MTHSRPARTLFWGVRTVLTLPPFFLTVEPVSSKLFTHSLWHELTALYCFDESRISCKIHVGRQRSYRCSYKWFYGESTLSTSPRLHFKLNAIHGHATWQHQFPSPLRLKIEKRRCQIARFTGGPWSLYIYLQHVAGEKAKTSCNFCH